MVIKDVDREDIDFIIKTLDIVKVSHIDHFTADKLAAAETAEEVNVGGEGKIVKILCS